MGKSAIIVGGAGGMGRWAVRAIALLGSVEQLVVADVDEARARRLAEEVGGPCEAVAVDATDRGAMRAAFAGVDVVLNTMGPFSLFAGPVLEAALEAGCDYLDIDDDWESTLEAFGYDDHARAGGCHVVKGIGGSPGVSNLAAVLAARRLDRVTEIVTGWSMRGAVLEEEPAYPSAGSGAALEHWLIQISGSIRAWRDGEERDIAPLQPMELEYPEIGRVRTYTVGHPEAVTLPRYLAGLERSTNVTSGPAWLFDHARLVAAEYDSGRIGLAEGAARIAAAERPADAAGPVDPLGTVWALARGERNGKPLTVTVEPTSMPRGKMGGGTGVALAVGLDLLCRGQINQPGVHAPEGVIDPEAFFARYFDFAEPRPTSLEEALRVREG